MAMKALNLGGLLAFQGRLNRLLLRLILKKESTKGARAFCREKPSVKGKMWVSSLAVKIKAYM
jgi:hypothetical protein